MEIKLYCFLFILEFVDMISITFLKSHNSVKAWSVDQN